MAVQVKLFPTLQKLSKSQRETFAQDWHEGLTPQDILTDEGFNERDSDAVLAVINDVQATLTTPLGDGDGLELRVNIQGG